MSYVLGMPSLLIHSAGFCVPGHQWPPSAPAALQPVAPDPASWALALLTLAHLCPQPVLSDVPTWKCYFIQETCLMPSASCAFKPARRVPSSHSPLDHYLACLPPHLHTSVSFCPSPGHSNAYHYHWLLSPKLHLESSPNNFKHLCPFAQCFPKPPCPHKTSLLGQDI